VAAIRSPEAVVLATSATAFLQTLHFVLPAGAVRDAAEQHVVTALATALEGLE
jgi:hypothetical protein